MSYEVDILADSVSEDGVRLTTFEVTFPRFILAEVNTHRMLSRNSGSSRAIPTEKFIAALEENPFVPEFNQRVKGMGVGEAFTFEKQSLAEYIWLEARDAALDAATRLMKLGVDKSRANRILEPFMWHTAIISATDWGNFVALRTDEGAQPEFRIIAKMMQQKLRDYEPRTLRAGEWHLPLITSEDKVIHTDEWDRYGLDWPVLKKIAVGRIARRSSYNRTDPEPFEASVGRHDTLSTSGHWSPFEHVARPFEEWPPNAYAGNFHGWHQYRKDFPWEHDFSVKLEMLAEGYPGKAYS